MNRKKLKIKDVAKELQTSDFKMMIYRQIEKFVYKNQKHYYPHFKGELHDLIVDLFTKFCEPKKHRNGETFSELDRVDPGKVGGGKWTGDNEKAIATYVQRYVIARLIDLERTDKKEVSISENYDEKNPGLTVDRAARGGKNPTGGEEDGPGAYEENINYQFYDLMDNPQAIKNARKFLVENPAQVKRIRSLAKHYDDKLDPEVKEFITKLLGEEEEQEKVSSNITEVQKDIEGLLGEGVKVSRYFLQKKPAVKVVFSDKDAMKAAEDKKDSVISLMSNEGYEFYKAHGANWYFFKKQEVGDSV